MKKNKMYLIYNKEGNYLEMYYGKKQKLKEDFLIELTKKENLT